MKLFKDCKLAFKYKYIDKYVPIDTKKDDVTAKGLVLHQCFENILKKENYVEDTPGLAHTVATESEVLDILKTAMEENELSIQAAVDYRIKLGLKRWLDFKHNYLDPRGHVLYAEKEHRRVIFGDTMTTAILDLLEDNGDGTYRIYDYKTPAKANNSNYKSQLLIYAYVQAISLGLIQPDSTDYETVANKFSVFVFYPLIEGDYETYSDSLKQIKFKAEDVQKAVEELKQTDTDITTFNFNVSAHELSPITIKYTCNWCEYCGAKAQIIDGVVWSGCPITANIGCESKHQFKKK